jgi:hypothetical protein
MKTFKAALILLIFLLRHMKAQQSRASDQAELEKIICLIISDEV